MKRCSAPCVGYISKNQYDEDVIEAKNYLTSSDSQTIKKLEREIMYIPKDLNLKKLWRQEISLKELTLSKKSSL